MPAENVGAEISQLMRHGPSRGPQKGRRMGQRQAVAVALDEARRGEFGKTAKRKASRRKRRSTRG